VKPFTLEMKYNSEILFNFYVGI